MINTHRVISILLLIVCSSSYVVASAANDPSELTLQSSPDDQTHHIAKLHDIYAPVNLPVGPNWYYILLISAVFVVLAILLIAFFLRKKRKQPDPITPLHISALDKLTTIRHYIESGDSLIYSQKASEILRGYIEQRFGIDSTRQTTAEFFAILKKEQNGSDDLLQHAALLESCLNQCDLAKYAHKTSDRENLKTVESKISTFITETAVEDQ